MPTPKTTNPVVRFRVGIRLPDWASSLNSRLFEGLLDFQRTAGSMELHFDQPSGGDLPPVVIDESWNGDGLIVYRHTKREAQHGKGAASRS